MSGLPPGVTKRFTDAGVPVLRIHYSADPERDAEWVKRERRKYSSQAAWDREQEIVHEAGGGELLFRHILNRYRDKVLITDPAFQPSPYWKDIGGFDHGGTNPTAALVGKVDHDGCIILMGEYYWAPASEEQKRGAHAHAEEISKLPNFKAIREVMADPSIFYKNQQQADGSFRAIADMYEQAGIKNLAPAPDNTEITGMERILEHWRDLDNREPTLKIFCPSNLDYEKKHYGLFQRGCPNLIWELRRARRATLTAQQLLTKNPTEKIVDKDNHLRDCLKYIVLSLPAPARIPLEKKLSDLAKKVETGEQSLTNIMIQRKKLEQEVREESEPVFVGGRAKVRQAAWRSRTKARNYSKWKG